MSVRVMCRYVNLVVIFILMVPLVLSCQSDVLAGKDMNGMEAVWRSSADVPGHPRLFLLKGEEENIKAILADVQYAKVHNGILSTAENLLSKPLSERVLTGKRLLDVSRECIKRIFYWSYAYRMTADSRFLKRARQEMLAVASFSDWNPSHFLDVAEMTVAMSIGYDWLYDDLPDTERALIKDAILKKGLEPSMDSENNDFLWKANNWNQVCNAAMVIGALALYEDDEEFAKEIITRSVASIKLALSGYGIDGNYPEGYGYWGYGTSYQAIFFSALQKALQTDFGLLIDVPGFDNSGQYALQMIAPSLLSFNYSDTDSGTSMNPTLFWFAQREHDSSLLWIERQQIERATSFSYRLLPFLLLWASEVGSIDMVAPRKNVWVARNANAVAVMRTSWSNRDAIYVGVKGGSPAESHGHMDVGSFVLEAQGVRWGIDLGMQDYNSLESYGLSIFGTEQDSERWKVFHMNNFSHNTLAVDGQLQRVDGDASFISYSDNPLFMNAVLDLTPVYEGLLQEVRRGVAIIDNGFVVVQDEIKTLNRMSTGVRWSMATQAAVEVVDRNTFCLSQGERRLLVEVVQPRDVVLKVWSAIGKYEYDASNEGCSLIGFDTWIPGNVSRTLQVRLIPECSPTSGQDVPALSEWKVTSYL